MALFGKESEHERRRAQDWEQWLKSQNPYAIASTVLGIVSFIEMGVLIVFGIGGVVLGITALKQLKRDNPQPPHGRGLAWTGIISSSISLVIAMTLYLYPLLKR